MTPEQSLDRRHWLQAAAALGGVAGAWPLAGWAQAARGGTLVVGTTMRPRHLNAAVQSGPQTMFPAAQIFASPLRMDANWQPQPWLAERWTLSPDNRSVTLHLRRDAVFHDGHPVTAEDLKFSLETLRDHHPFKSMYAPLNAVTIENSHTAVVRLSEPHPALLLAMSTALSPILPRHIFGDGTDPKVHPRNANPIGCGPFKLVEFKPGEHIVMERFDRFFIKDLPRLDRLIIREFKDPASLLLAFERGEVDVHPVLTDARDLERARKVPGAQLVTGAAPAIGPVTWLAFNIANPKLADKRVRQAISYAIDRRFVLDQLLSGLHGPATGPIASGSPYYSADVERYAYNLDKSRQLLDAAGAKPGAGGTRFALELDSHPGAPDMRAIQEYIKPALAKVGIEVAVRTSPDFPTWIRRVSSQQFEMTLDSMWNWGDPVIGVHRAWLSSNIRPGVIWTNTQSYRNDKVDALLAAAGQEMNQARRKALYKDMQRIVVDDCPVAFLYEMKLNEAYRANVVDVPKGIWGLIDTQAGIGVRKG
jgi:peptide/nickel transport system substrate-binding protein